MALLGIVWFMTGYLGAGLFLTKNIRRTSLTICLFLTLLGACIYSVFQG